jgi:hypothetical protein
MANLTVERLLLARNLRVNEEFHSVPVILGRAHAKAGDTAQNSLSQY